MLFKDDHKRQYISGFLLTETATKRPNNLTSTTTRTRFQLPTGQEAPLQGCAREHKHATALMPTRQQGMSHGPFTTTKGQEKTPRTLKNDVRTPHKQPMRTRKMQRRANLKGSPSSEFLV